MAARTTSSSGGGAAAYASVLLGLLAVAAVPVGIAASRVLQDVRLLESIVITVPIAFVLSLIALSAARRARFRVDRSVFRRRARWAKLGRFLAWTGLYLAIVGALALAFYGVLHWVE